MREREAAAASARSWHTFATTLSVICFLGALLVAVIGILILGSAAREDKSVVHARHGHTHVGIALLVPGFLCCVVGFPFIAWLLTRVTFMNLEDESPTKTFCFNISICEFLVGVGLAILLGGVSVGLFMLGAMYQSDDVTNPFPVLPTALVLAFLTTLLCVICYPMCGCCHLPEEKHRFVADTEPVSQHSDNSNL